MNTEELMPLVTPGEILAEEFLRPLGVSEYRLAKDTGILAEPADAVRLGSAGARTGTPPSPTAPIDSGSLI